MICRRNAWRDVLVGGGRRRRCIHLGTPVGCKLLLQTLARHYIVIGSRSQIVLGIPLRYSGICPHSRYFPIIHPEKDSCCSCFLCFEHAERPASPQFISIITWSAVYDRFNSARDGRQVETAPGRFSRRARPHCGSAIVYWRRAWAGSCRLLAVPRLLHTTVRVDGGRAGASLCSYSYRIDRDRAHRERTG